MSVMVVRIGPEASAGSMLKRRSRRGTTPPIETATTVLAAIAAPTTRPRKGLPFHSHAAAAMGPPSASPLMAPTALIEKLIAPFFQC